MMKAYALLLGGLLLATTARATFQAEFDYLNAPAPQSSKSSLKETSTDSTPMRFQAGLLGRFGTEAEAPGFSETASLYGVGFEYQFLLESTETYDLWFGIGANILPEQDFIDVSGRFNIDAPAYMTTLKSELSSYELALMLIPEWKVNENLTLGLRWGIALARAEASVKIDSWSYSQDETLFSGILGAHAIYQFSPNFGIFGTLTGRVGNDLDLEFNGYEASVNNAAIDLCLGVTYTF